MTDTDKQPTPQTSWVWPAPPRSNRYGATVTEVLDTASDDRRVAVIEGPVWPPVGSRISVFEDAAHIRSGVVSRVELILGSSGPARIVVWADLTRDPD